MTEIRNKALRRGLKIGLLAAVWFVDLPVRMALATEGLSEDDAATIELLDLGCEEVTGSSWLPWLLDAEKK